MMMSYSEGAAWLASGGDEMKSRKATVKAIGILPIMISPILFTDLQDEES